MKGARSQTENFIQVETVASGVRCQAAKAMVQKYTLSLRSQCA